jgi:DNA polymerase
MHADAREELGQLVRAFRLYLERQARAGAYSVSAAPMPPVALADDAEAGISGTPEIEGLAEPEALTGEPAGEWPEAFADEPAAGAHHEERAPAPRQPVRHAPLPSLDEHMPSFEAALAAVLDEPPSRPAPQRGAQRAPATHSSTPQATHSSTPQATHSSTPQATHSSTPQATPEATRLSARQETRQGARQETPLAAPPATLQAEPQSAPRRGRAALADVRADLGDCQRCKLAGQRTNIVFGVGDPGAALMFIGEAPGYHEDQRGEPFVGPAGELLDLMIQAMGWTRDTVYIANVLKCRPPGNRDPQPDEVAACQPFLARQIDAVAPRIIVTLGKPAAQLLLQSNAPISALRGRFQEYRGIRVMPTYHPAFLLRNPERKRDTWNDLKLVIAELERLGIPSPRPPKT